LGRIKIYKVEKTNGLILTYEGPDDKRKLNFKRQIQNWMFKDSIEIFQGLINLLRAQLQEKIIFEFNLGFN
jgi:hypothetical protein